MQGSANVERGTGRASPVVEPDLRSVEPGTSVDEGAIRLLSSTSNGLGNGIVQQRELIIALTKVKKYRKKIPEEIWIRQA
jgi:hypothetical protein